MPKGNLLTGHPWRWYWLALVVVAIDIATKVWAVDRFMYGPAMQIIPGLLQFTYAENYGAAFSFLADAGGWQIWLFAVITIFFCGLVIPWIWRVEAGKRWEPFALGLLLGGALGNFWDRMVLGYVRDFISVYYGNWSFPVFNVADMAICIGAAMILIELIFFAEHKQGDGDKKSDKGSEVEKV